MKLGIDVGGTMTKVAVIDGLCSIQYSRSSKTVCGREAFPRFITSLIQEARASFPAIQSVGIGIPGKIDTIRGNIVCCPALQIENMEFCASLRQACGLPVFIDNDVNVWALAEQAVGCCRDADSYVLITIGTGIGAGIVIGGQIYRGHNFEAGEIGYMVSEEDYGHPCPSKTDFGPFEKRASAIAVSNRYNQAVREREEDAQAGINTGNNAGNTISNSTTSNVTGIPVDTREVFRRALQDGDPLALRLIEDQMKALAVGISNIICILQPQKVVIGGGLAGEGEYLTENLNRYVRRLIPTEVPVVLSQAGKWGGAVGAALAGGCGAGGHGA